MDSPTLSLLPFPMVHFYLECRRARHPFFRLRSGAASARHSSPNRGMPAESSSPFLSFFGNLPTFQHSNFQTILRSIPFRITSFADPHPLTLTESYSYKKQGRGWGIRRSPAFPLFSTTTKYPTHSNARNSNFFMRLLDSSPDTQGGTSFRRNPYLMICPLSDRAGEHL
jgi:hypothetical protein